MYQIEEISEKGWDIEWPIKNFLSLSNRCYRSPYFSSANESWFLQILPYSCPDPENLSGRYVTVHLHRDAPDGRLPIRIEFTLGMKTADGKLDHERHITHNFENSFSYSSVFAWVRRSELFERSDLLPSGTLTLVCRLKQLSDKLTVNTSNSFPFRGPEHAHNTSAQASFSGFSFGATAHSSNHIFGTASSQIDGQDITVTHPRSCPQWNQSPVRRGGGRPPMWGRRAIPFRPPLDRRLSDTVTTKCSYCNKNLGTREDIQCHLRQCEDFPINCPKCRDDVALKNLFHHQCLMTDEKADGTLYEDFKKMLLDGQNHDLTLKIGNKEFRAHQDVLKARCPVFESMLNHDTTEKESSVINIPDCDPQAMELFLLYVYCGKVETLDPTNMLELYYIADKYDMQSLKQQCCDFIKKSLSYTNICEVIQLALTHSDTNLLEYATEYFMDNTVDIMETVEWQSFLKDNATQANELMLKSFRKVKDSENQGVKKPRLY